MTFWDWIRAIFAPYKPQAAVSPRAPLSSGSGTRALPAGRVSVDMSSSVITDGWIVVPPNDYESNWRTLNLDATHLDRLPPHELLDMLADLSPEISRAVWDFQRLFNPGWEVKCFRPNSEKTEYQRAQVALDAFLDTLRDQYGSCDVVWGRIAMGAFMRGSMAAELVLDGAGRLPLDIATPDPYSIRFRKRRDPVRGLVWQPGQWQQGTTFVPLDIPTFRYIPIDPMPGVPYGRPLVAPALFTSIFLLGLLHDIKRVVMQQGYKRMDISIDTEQAIASYQQSNDGFATFGEYVAGAVAAVKTAYAALEPDDAFIHSDMIVLNPPAGTVDSDSIGAIDSIIEKLERMATRALKSNSLLMGNDESASETDSNRRWEVHVAGIKSLQHHAENLLESLLTVALEAQGIQARVEFRFAELRAAEELRDEQTRALKIANSRAEYEAGYTSQDEAANHAVGHDADAPEPRGGVGAPQPEMVQGDGDGQEVNSGVAAGRSRPLTDGAIQERVTIIPDGASEPLLPVPDEVTISDSDVDRAAADWDELMPDYAGLLEATVQGQTNPAERAITTSAETPWTWDANSHRYRNTASGQYIGQRQMTGLRDQFIEAKRESMVTLANELAGGGKSLQEFEVAFRREIKTVFVDQYVMAKGGRNAMTPSDWGTVGRMVRDQYVYAHDFARDIAAGKLSAAQIANRANAYMHSATQAFEQGRSASYGLPTLPSYPADGSQICRSNCRCSWRIEETEDAWNCTWTTSSGESCATCVDNAARWNPLVILKSAGGREAVERILEGIQVHSNGYH